MHSTVQMYTGLMEWDIQSPWKWDWNKHISYIKKMWNVVLFSTKQSPPWYLNTTLREKLVVSQGRKTVKLVRYLQKKLHNPFTTPPCHVARWRVLVTSETINNSIHIPTQLTNKPKATTASMAQQQDRPGHKPPHHSVWIPNRIPPKCLSAYLLLY